MGFLPSSAAASIYIFKPLYAIGSVPSLPGHAIVCPWRSLPRVRRHRASKPQVSFERVLPWQVTMDHLICPSLHQVMIFTKISDQTRQRTLSLSLSLSLCVCVCTYYSADNGAICPCCVDDMTGPNHAKPLLSRAHIIRSSKQVNQRGLVGSGRSNFSWVYVSRAANSASLAIP